MSNISGIDQIALDILIKEVSASGGAETANTQIFIERLTKALDLPTPDFASEENEHNDYTFERRVDFKFPDGSTSIGRIDCYKRDCFVLEAKQSSKRKRDTRQPDLLSEDAKQKKLGMAKRGTSGWDKSMRAARKQAENYARALPVSHGYPPFLLVLDVGNVLEVYADFSGQGKNYAQFPDRNSYRLTMDDLLEAEVQDRLRKIWLEPQTLNPSLISAVVTRDIAERLAKIAKRLEGDYDSEVVAHFLMRCLFTMFAEDVGLIPIKSFENLLEELKDTPETFVPMLEALWKAMDKGDFSPALRTTLRHFNGGLFADCRALPLDSAGIHELWVAAKRDWSDVEPAIFGTLLEQALDPRERGKLGAHYTPRTYVERLVIPTIIEPLREDWEDVLAHVNDLHDEGKDDEALNAVKTFHHALCTTRVLDPACGTGNFLYVSLELMKRLEGEVLDTLDDLGLADPKLAFEGETVTPRQFFGLDLNERAVAIADLVLWLGHIKWQLRTTGLDSISDPVLEKLGNIRHQDAILAYDDKTLARDDDGNPITRWNGYSYKAHPITGKDIPDPEARVESYNYENPKRAIWPEAEFIVGNPPFIGNKRMKDRLGEGFTTALRGAYNSIPESVDLVMYWWAKAAELVQRGKIKRVGLVTTNKITQNFNRRVVEQFITGKKSISISFAVPDQAWVGPDTDADVRVAMSVLSPKIDQGKVLRIQGGKFEGNRIVGESITERTGLINSGLDVGANLNSVRQLFSNNSLAHQGVIPIGVGFRLGQEERNRLELNNSAASSVIKDYKIGRDLQQRDQGLSIIDLFAHDWETVVRQYPSIAQIILDRVKPQRETNNRPKRKENFWLFADSCEEMRAGLDGLSKAILTCRTSKHRTFTFESSRTLPDAKIVCLTIENNAQLGCLSSRVHIAYSNRRGGFQGVGNDPVYQHTDTFNSFPFPGCINDETRPKIREVLSDLGERLDTHRKSVIEKYHFLTMTGIYNVLERVRELDAGIGDPLSDSEKNVYDAALIGILKEIHDDIDRATLEAYGWSDLAPALVGKVGATLPSPHKFPEQEAAEEELLSRLVALNIARREEERTGKVRWLRPDYQIPKLGHKVKAETKDMDVAPVLVDDAPAWPKDGLDQIKVVRELLVRSDAPVLSDAVSASFKGRNTAKRKTRVLDVLETLVATGIVRKTEDNKSYFITK